MVDCIFCKIIKGEIPCAKVYEDKFTLAFLDINPATPKGGHILVLPKKHYELITDLPEEEFNHLCKTIKKISEALLKYGEGLNIIQNNKKVAGQLIPHIHFHLIPRFEKDNVVLNYWKTHKYNDNELKDVSEKIKNLLK